MNPKFNIPTIPKDNAFNAIRLLLCLTVILAHTPEHFGISSTRFISGYVAIRGFFIISGFWVTKSYFCSDSLKTFFLKRAKKILPMYYISVVGFSLICSCVSELPATEYFSNPDYFKYLFWNGIFLNFMHPSLPGCFDDGPVNGALWTIKVELGFYMILPLILFFWEKIKTVRGKNALLITLYVLFATYNLILNAYAEQLHLSGQLTRQLPNFIPHFVAGMFIYLNWESFLKVKNWLVIPSAAIFILRYYIDSFVLYPAAFAILIVWAALFFKKLSFIGRNIDLSYGMYLYHFPLIQILYYFTKDEISIPAFVATAIATTAILAFVIEKYVQKKIKP